MSNSRYTVGLGEGTGISSRIMQPPGGDSHDVFGQSDLGSPGHLRVLKPPGGGSSDIFGTNNTDSDSGTPRRVKNYLASSILSPSDVNSTPGSGNGYKKMGIKSSQERLFGACEGNEKQNPVKPIKNNIFGIEDGEESTQYACMAQRSAANPVTGEGYEEKMEPVQKRRNPPGGASSKLW